MGVMEAVKGHMESARKYMGGGAGCGNKGKLLEEVASEQSFGDFLEARDARLGSLIFFFFEVKFT